MPPRHYWLIRLARQVVANIAPSVRVFLDFLGGIVAPRLGGFPGIFGYQLLCSRGNECLQLHVHLFRRLRRMYRHCE